jgi:hypothetical protein
VVKFRKKNARKDAVIVKFNSKQAVTKFSLIVLQSPSRRDGAVGGLWPQFCLLAQMNIYRPTFGTKNKQQHTGNIVIIAYLGYAKGRLHVHGAPLSD